MRTGATRGAYSWNSGIITNERQFMTTFLFYYSLALTIVVLWQNRTVVREFIEAVVEWFRGR